MHQPIALAGQLGDLARLGLASSNSSRSKRTQRQFTLAVFTFRGQSIWLAPAQLADAFGQGHVFLPRHVEVAKGVEQLQLIGGMQQRFRLTLAVNVNEDYYRSVLA